MRRGLSRRDFVKSTTSGAVAAAALSPIRAAEGVPAPAIIPSTGARPIIIASANGNFHRNGGTKTCVETAFALMMQGTDVLEALIAGVNIVELDPEDTSVGYGGLPNAAGVVQLDACCMHGPTRRAGGVAALEGVRTPSKVAHAVMENTDHHLLVGPGAQEFARNMGFQIEADLNTKRSRQAWLEWKRRTELAVNTALTTSKCPFFRRNQPYTPATESDPNLPRWCPLWCPPFAADMPSTATRIGAPP